MTENPSSIAAMKEEKEVPVLIANHLGLITHINSGFENTFGWCKNELVGCPLTRIIPPVFQDAHHLGFSRFISTGEARLLGQVVKLSILNKVGRESPPEHYIIAEKQSGQWVFGATSRCQTDVATSVQ